ncbi:YdeI/OmpD-associated family protein [Algoriphagus namhaensis]
MRLILEGDYYLERFDGKGGWTYLPLRKESFAGVKSFGMLKVSGQIDDFSFEKKHLMPKGDGTLFLPVAKEIRQKIGKEAGDRVHVKLFRPEIPKGIPEEILACLEDVPGKKEAFFTLTPSAQRKWVEYIYENDSLDIRTQRVIQLLQEL